MLVTQQIQSNYVSLRLITLHIKHERLTEKAFVLDRGLGHSGKAPDGVKKQGFNSNLEPFDFYIKRYEV